MSSVRKPFMAEILHCGATGCHQRERINAAARYNEVVAILSVFLAAAVLAAGPKSLPLEYIQASLGIAELDFQGNLRVVWDPKAPLIANARDVEVTIRDGKRTSAITLSAAQLNLGSLLYQRVSPEVVVRFEIWTPEGRRVFEFVRFISGPGILNASTETKAAPTRGSRLGVYLQGPGGQKTEIPSSPLPRGPQARAMRGSRT